MTRGDGDDVISAKIWGDGRVSTWCACSALLVSRIPGTCRNVKNGIMHLKEMEF